MKKYDFFSNKMTLLEIILTIPLFTALVIIANNGGGRPGSYSAISILIVLIHIIFNLKSKIYLTHFINTFPVDRVRYTRQLGKYIISKMICVVLGSGLILLLIRLFFELNIIGLILHFILLSLVITSSLYYSSAEIFLQRKSFPIFTILAVALNYYYLVSWPIYLVVNKNYSLLNLSILFIVAVIVILSVTISVIKSLLSAIPETGESYDPSTN